MSALLSSASSVLSGTLSRDGAAGGSIAGGSVADGGFDTLFQGATGHEPLPWQEELFNKFVSEKFFAPAAPASASANIPTGLGKTSVVAIWLLALARQTLERNAAGAAADGAAADGAGAVAVGAGGVAAVPRRLVYVVNRRTVVDQTTAEVEKLRDALANAAAGSPLAEVRDALRSLCALPLPADASPLAISTLRGQFADNGDWCADPSRPAVIVGTVDMIGSALLFSRYNTGFKTRPLHAAFLAQDALLVHDEAHLEPAFQHLLDEIVATQNTAGGDPRRLRVLELTATSRSEEKNSAPALTLSAADLENETVRKRYNAAKHLSFVPLVADEKLPVKLAALALQKATGTGGSTDAGTTDPDRAVLIFVRSVEDAVKIADALDKNDTKGRVATLTGTMRGKERDELVSANAVFQRFLPAA
ncbi:MAG: type I-U CRISPR-associated helicase/endonuclease Cas3, partial [Puniceicoccales bacterium]|nr:type I-U CRISPR-associated helicase/endonuclease Cas3 [Puniceicoccales bacterium]